MFDLLTVTSNGYGKLITFLPTNREPNESFCAFKLCFNAQLSLLNSIAAHASITDSISALILLSIAPVDAIQRVSILAASSFPINLDRPTDFTDLILQLVKYEFIGIVLRHCDNSQNNTLIARAIASSTAYAPSRKNDTVDQMEAAPV